MIAKKWRADTQEVEGLNSALKALIQKAPNVSLVLASARLLIRKMLTIIGATGPRLGKWSLLKPITEELLKEALVAHHKLDEMDTEQQRFGPMLVEPLPESETFEYTQLADVEASRTGDGFAWACRKNASIWHSECVYKTTDDRGKTQLTAIHVGGALRPNDELYVCTSAMKKVGMWALCFAKTRTQIEIHNHLRFGYSVDVFHTFWNRVRTGEAIPVNRFDVQWKILMTSIEGSLANESIICILEKAQRSRRRRTESPGPAAAPPAAAAPAAAEEPPRSRRRRTKSPGPAAAPPAAAAPAAAAPAAEIDLDPDDDSDDGGDAEILAAHQVINGWASEDEDDVEAEADILAPAASEPGMSRKDMRQITAALKKNEPWQAISGRRSGRQICRCRY